MDTVITLSPQDRLLIADLTAQLRRYNDLTEENREDKLLGCQEAAQHLGVTRQTISQMLRDHRLHKVMRGGRQGILLSELNKTK